MSNDLITRLKGRDPEAFAEIYLMHSSHVRRLAVRWMGNSVDADDITQEVFLRVWRFAHTFRKEADSLKCWLLQITANTMKEEFRQRARRITPVDVDPEAWTVLHPGEKSLRDRGPDPYRLALNCERASAIERAARGLKANEREAAMMNLQGLSDVEMAGKTGVSVPAAKSRAYRGRVALAAALREWRAA